jgi:hypothetical protein
MLSSHYWEEVPECKVNLLALQYVYVAIVHGADHTPWTTDWFKTAPHPCRKASVVKVTRVSRLLLLRLVTSLVY